METYEELRAKMIEAFGYEETERIAKMASDYVKNEMGEGKQ